MFRIFVCAGRLPALDPLQSRKINNETRVDVSRAHTEKAEIDASAFPLVFATKTARNALAIERCSVCGTLV